MAARYYQHALIIIRHNLFGRIIVDRPIKTFDDNQTTLVYAGRLTHIPNSYTRDDHLARIPRYYTSTIMWREDHISSLLPDSLERDDGYPLPYQYLYMF